MLRSKFTRVFMGAAVATALLGTAGMASAASVLQIQFSGLDMVYDGRAIYDAGYIHGAHTNTGEADPLVTMSFLVDGVNQGTLLNDIYADIFIPGVMGLPSGGGTINSLGYDVTAANAPATPGHAGAYGFFDLLQGPPNSGNGGATGGLLLNLDSSVQVTYSGNEIFVNGGGTTNSIYDQALPFNLSLDTPVEFSFSLNNLQNVTTSGAIPVSKGLSGVNGDYVTGFFGSGTGEINGPTTAIPEPATLLLVGLGLLGGGAVNRRRKK